MAHRRRRPRSRAHHPSSPSSRMGDDGAQEPGDVALSRVRTLAGLSLAGLNQRALEVHPEVRAKDEEFRAQSQKSRETFTAMPNQELATMHSNFIRACGGKLGAGPKQKEARVPTLEATFSLLEKARSIEEIAKKRGLA